MIMERTASGLLIPHTPTEQSKPRYPPVHNGDLCPNCGTGNYETTTMGWFGNRNPNHIHCSCGWRGRGWELVNSDEVPLSQSIIRGRTLENVRR